MGNGYDGWLCLDGTQAGSGRTHVLALQHQRMTTIAQYSVMSRRGAIFVQPHLNHASYSSRVV